MNGYKRHGVVDLYAALEVATGKVTHRVSESHTATAFLAFMDKVERAYPSQELRVIFFGILGKQSLSETDFPSKEALREHLAAYMRSWNKNPTPFAWTKPANAIIKSHRRMLDRISAAVH